MQAYSVTLSKKAQEQLDDLDDKIADALFAAIAGLGENPRPPGCIKLKGLEGWRIRVGSYRVIYKLTMLCLKCL